MSVGDSQSDMSSRMEHPQQDVSPAIIFIVTSSVTVMKCMGDNYVMQREYYNSCDNGHAVANRPMGHILTARPMAE